MDLWIAALRLEKNFFRPLLAGDITLLVKLLSDDFVLIDVMRGLENTKQNMLEAIACRQIEFQTIQPSCVRVRAYDRTAVATGRTLITGRANDSDFEVTSRYTHVFVEQQGGLRIVSAQGTLIAE